MAKRKQSSHLAGWIIAGLLGVVAYQSGILDGIGRIASQAQQVTSPTRATQSDSASERLNKPRYVNVASLNVRHTPSASGPLIMALPRGTPIKVLDRKDGWLLIDLSPTLEGWVTERFTTVQAPLQPYVPPAPLVSSR
ncbi:SH3 domain-containing protein [Devosia rhizoryzae]|uniref:SH3 domain-containing protein n=1 Tax=Devosia rhizoryzae TaxID=2774137 RepID=A0ABX7C2A6_9HYPH|nr:SH3 domain-containing protein [Devosia rhizoryzae]